MESHLDLKPYDLVSPDGVITNITSIDENNSEAIVFIEKITPAFVGFKIPKEHVIFNIKSTLAQIGIDGIGTEWISMKRTTAHKSKSALSAHGPLARELLKLLTVGT